MSMTIQQATEAWERSYNYLVGLGDQAIPVNMDFAKITLEALREKAERDNPKPLIYEELLQMNNEVVWFEVLDKSDNENPCESAWSKVWVADWMPPPVVYFWLFGNECELEPTPKNYGRTWICYRHKPKGERK